MMTRLFLAATYLFMLNRFGGIEVKDTDGVGVVRMFQESKEGEKFTSMVALKNGVTPDGSLFEIQQLAGPVVNDKERHINSGSYRLRIVGASPALQARLPMLADFARTDEAFTFYGEKVE
jgi:hypothetical protein